MRKLTLAVNAASILGLVGLGWVYFASPVAAQCTGVFPPNTLCGNLGATAAPPAAFSATTSVVGPGASTSGYYATYGSTNGRVLSQSPKPWLTPQEFGAKGDGVTDDTGAIQAAINTVAVLPNGGIVLFPCLTYLISSTLSISAGVSLEGACHGAFLSKTTSNVNNAVLLWSFGGTRGPLLNTNNRYTGNIEHLGLDCAFTCEAAIQSTSPDSSIWEDLDIRNIQTGTDLGFQASAWYITQVGGVFPGGGQANSRGNVMRFVSIHDLAPTVVGINEVGATAGNICTGVFTQNVMEFLAISTNNAGPALQLNGCSDTNTWLHAFLQSGTSGSALTLGTLTTSQDTGGDMYGNVFIGGSIESPFGGAGSTSIKGQNNVDANMFYGVHVTSSGLILNNVDGNLKVCFNVCIQEKGGTETNTPAVSSCGTSPSVLAGSTNLAGVITTGTSSTGCTLTFGTAFFNTPFCVVSSQTNLASLAYTVATSSVIVTQAVANNNKINYYCNPQLGG